MLTLIWVIIGFAAVAGVFTGLIFSFWALGFFLLFVGAAYCSLAGYVLAAPKHEPAVSQTGSAVGPSLILAVVALIGLMLMFYDRTVLRGIDYLSLGIAGARAEFNTLGERGGAFSVVGNILSAVVYLPLANLIFDWEKWDKRRHAVALCVLLGLFGLTFMTGGRTALLIATAISVAAILGRAAVGLPRLPRFLTILRVAILSVVLLAVFGLIFALRASAFGSADGADYLADLCFHLSQPAVEIMSQCFSLPINTGWAQLNEFANYGMAVALYAFHVSWVADVAIVDTNPGVSTAFVGLQQMFLSRLGYQVTATDYDGYFMPASASLVFDFGYLTMIAGFVLLGFLIRIAQTRLLQGSYLLGRVAFCYLVAALLLSILINPLNLPIFILAMMAAGMVAAGAATRRLLGMGQDIPASATMPLPARS